eukprot:273240_1
MAAKKRNHVDAIKRNQALHTFMFQTNSTSFMLKDGPSSTKTAKTGCAHSHSKHIWCNICRKAIAYHNMQNAQKSVEFCEEWNFAKNVYIIKLTMDNIKFVVQNIIRLENSVVIKELCIRLQRIVDDVIHMQFLDKIFISRNTRFLNLVFDNTIERVPFDVFRSQNTIQSQKCKRLSRKQRKRLFALIYDEFNPRDTVLTHSIIHSLANTSDCKLVTELCVFDAVFAIFKGVDRTLWQKMEIEQEAIKSKKKTRKALKRKHCKTDKRKKKTIAHAKKKQTKMNDVMIVNALPEEDNGYDENVSPSIEEVRDEHSIKTPKHKSLSSRTRRQLLKLIVKFDPHHVELTDDILNDISRNPAFEMYTKYELYRNVFSFFKTVARTLFDGMVVQHNEEIEKKKKRKMKRRKHCKTDAKKKRNAKKKKKRTIEYNFDSEESNGICDSEESNGICDSEGEPNRKLRRSKRLQKNKQIAIQNEVQRESQIKFCIDECIQNEKSEDGDVTWIECEGNNCARKWFHIECLGIAENELSDIKNYFCNDCM